METNPADSRIEALLARIEDRLERIEKRLASLEGPAKARRDAESHLLTMRESAWRLGISRATLKALVKERRVRSVAVAGKTRIALAEIERIAAKGTRKVVTKDKRRTAPAQPPSVTVTAAPETASKV